MPAAAHVGIHRIPGAPGEFVEDYEYSRSANPTRTALLGVLQRFGADLHGMDRDNEVVVKYRIDGVLYEALDPIDKRHHSTIISRIKVMSELDISERRIPQDGRFKLRVRGRTISSSEVSPKGTKSSPGW